MKKTKNCKSELRKEKRKSKNGRKELLNIPIESTANDWIGVETYVDRLNSAIESGAQVIGITSDFGTGKSSLLSLYKAKYISSKKRNKLKYYTINMWDCIESKGIELHKSFLFRVINQLSVRKGSYISKRLNNNYGLLSLQSGSVLQSIIAALMILSGLVGFISSKFTDNLIKVLSVEEATLIWITRGSLLCTVMFAVILFIKADVVFSSVKSEGKTDIDENIIVDYFNKEVLYRGFRRHYIFVIEDLDRSNSIENVLNFLKQLRRYYLSDENWHTKFHKNRVSFVICIKPEALLYKKENEKHTNEGILYPKLFDYIINLNQINIDNYDVILDGFLYEIRDNLLSLKLIEKEQEASIKCIQGMSWLVRGQGIGIRDIKNRLNMSLLLYENLLSKFKEKGIVFKKCAITIYLMTEYSEDYYKLEDDTLEKVIELYMAGELTEDVNNWPIEDINLSDAFKEELYGLVKDKLIDSTYRTYFYNYPKNSKLYNAEQMAIYNSIVYREMPTDNDDYKRMLECVDEAVINDALEKLSLLNISLPVFIFDFDVLSKEAVKNYSAKVIELIGTFQFDPNNYKRSSQNVCKILKKRNYVENRITWLEKIGNCLYEKISDLNILLYIRQKMSETIGSDVLPMKNLFLESNVPFISESEIDEIKDIYTVVSLLNYDELAGNIEIAEKIHLKIIGNLSAENDAITRFYVELGNTECEESARFTREYCQIIRTIPDEIVELFDEKITAEQWKTLEYIKAISVIDRITVNQLNEISKLLWTEGLPPAVCNELHKNGFDKLYVANGVLRDLFTDDLENEVLYNTIYEDVNWFNTYANTSVIKLRYDILKKQSNIEKFSFLFMEPFETITRKETFMILDYQTLIGLIKNRQLTEEQIEYLAEYFGKKHRNPRETYEILSYIIGLPKEDAKSFFYRLDAEAFSYNRMSAKNRKIIEEKLFDILEVRDDAEEIVKFLKHTRTANQELEKDLYLQLRGNDLLRGEYIKFVNKLSSVNATTLRNITNIGVYGKYSEVVNKRLFDAKIYDDYVYSKFLSDGYFRIEEEKETILWSTYVEMFHWNEEKKIVEKMRENESFMQMLVERKEYVNAGTVIERYSSALQSKDLLLFLFETLPEKQLIVYFEKMKGFIDYDAAHCFVEKIQEHNAILINKGVYENCHGKMINPGLQGWYTRVYKKS